MKYNSDIHHRRSIRLKNFDYSEAWYYFVTICAGDRFNLFGDIMDGKMELNDIGQMIFNVWDEIPKYYDGIDIDEFQIMPNHIHGIVIIKNKTGKHGIKAGRHGDLPVHEPKRGLSLPDVMERFKSLTTKKYIDGVKLNNWKPFNKRLWQRNYYEHVIRDENDLKCTREYIINNPIKWEMDEYYK